MTDWTKKLEDKQDRIDRQNLKVGETYTNLVTGEEYYYATEEDLIDDRRTPIVSQEMEDKSDQPLIIAELTPQQVHKPEVTQSLVESFEYRFILERSRAYRHRDEYYRVAEAYEEGIPFHQIDSAVDIRIGKCRYKYMAPNQLEDLRDPSNDQGPRYPKGYFYYGLNPAFNDPDVVAVRETLKQLSLGLES